MTEPSAAARPLRAAPRVPRRNFYPAATCYVSFDYLIRRFEATPEHSLLKAGPGRYREFAVQVGSGRFVTFTGWEAHPARGVEVGLELVDGEFFFVADLEEVLTALEVPLEETTRVQNGFTWR